MSLLTTAEADALAAPYRRTLPGPPRTLEDYRRQPPPAPRRSRRLRSDVTIGVVDTPSLSDQERHRQRSYDRRIARERHAEAEQAALGFRWDLSVVQPLLSDARACSRALRGLL